MRSEKKSFNNIKIHTQYSICEGAAKIEDLAEYCKENKIFTVGLLGFDGGALDKKVDLSSLIKTPPNKYELVENMHMIICHLISSYLK